MNNENILCKTDLVEIFRFTHSCPEPHRDPKEEFSSKYSINFTEKDRFGLRVGRNEWLMTSEEVFFTRPNLVFRCRHFEDFPQDVCFSVCFDENFVEEIRCAGDIGLKNYSPSVKLTNRLAFIHWKLAECFSRGGDPLEIETIAGQLFVEISKAEKPRKLFSEKQKNGYFERVEAVSNLLKTYYFENHSLASIARAVGVSPFHFSRIFREISGVAPHQYLLNVRLEKAKELLLKNSSVTETCFAVGFSNLSHFIRTFIRSYGVSPSKFPRRKNQ